MSGKDRDTTLNKLKQFFKMSKSSGSALIQRNDFPLTPELERELRPETPVAQRCKALRDLGDDVLNKRLEDSTVKKLWELTKDLIVPNKPTEQRHTAFVFFQKLIHGQYENLQIMRAHFFNVIQNHDVVEDIQYRLELLKSLTDNGKDITFFEEEIGRFMLEWIPQIAEARLIDNYLDILINLIKYNAAYLDKEVIVGIVQHAQSMSCTIEDTQIVLQWLSILDTVICYAILPNETLTMCIIALCRTVNRETYCEISWKIMKNLLGTNLGHASLLTMCTILNDRRSNDEFVLRGAVFHINMGLWGSTGSITPMLRCSPSAVLLSFLHALESRHLIVTLEVVISIQRLIQKCGNELPEYAWDVIFNILEVTSDNIEIYEKRGLNKDNIVQKHFHETLDSIETLLQKSDIAADRDVIYKLIEKVADDRPETSIIKLMEYKASRISATRPQWLQALNAFVERFYRIGRTQIRIKAIQSLVQIMEVNRAAYEDEILERIVLPIFSSVPSEKDTMVRAAVSQMLIEFAYHCETKRCLELLDIIEKLLNRPFDLFPTDAIVIKTENDLQDILILVEGLIKIFLIKLYQLPSSFAIRIFHLLTGHLELNYQRPNVLQMCSSPIKYKIFAWMLNARANASFHIGYPDPTNSNHLKFSHYLGIEGPYQQQYSTQLKLDQTASLSSNIAAGTAAQGAQSTFDIPSTNFTPISIRRGCKIFVKSLETERDYSIVQLILKELPNILQNKALIQGNDVDSLARTLYNMYLNETQCENYFLSSRPSLSDFRTLVLPVIACMATYHQCIEPTTQKLIVGALQKGLFSRTPRQCVQALTVMILEIPDTLVRLLPEVLWEMSRMSNTVAVGIPILEFLSTLSRLPNHRFANFITLQYMYVFAISIPYTNPDRYDHYTVSLAHHVIAGWFLKCRLHLRCNVVTYIIAALESNIHMPFQDMRSKADFAAINEDSSNRKRSSSLTEQGSRRRERPNIQTKPKSDLYDFHMELAETCIDFMARHTFSPCSALPKRLPTADFLLAGGNSLTWLVGHHLITITTSGCSASPFRNGLCDRCSTLCKSSSKEPSIGTPMSPDTSSSSRGTDSDFNQNKRYTKASLQHSNANESESSDLTSSTSSSAAATPYLQNQTGSNKFFRQSSTDGRYSSSSGSLEALSRRGSNPEAPENVESKSTESPVKHLSSTLGNTLLLPQLPALATTLPTTDRPRQLCACSCTGWAEICIRRPTGSMSWVMRIQNQISYDSFTNEFPLHDLTSLFTPSLNGGVIGKSFLNDLNSNKEKLSNEGSNVITNPKMVSISDQLSEIKYHDSNDSDKQDVSGQGVQREADENNESKNLIDKMKETLINKHVNESTQSSSTDPIDIPGTKKQQKPSENLPNDGYEDDNNNEDGVEFDDNDASRSRNPVRRVNSSPEMSSNWRNPFMNQKEIQDSDTQNNNNNNTVSGSGGVGGGGGAGSTYLLGDGYEQSNDIELKQIQQKKTNFSKDMRVSCEAIPEEIAGSTPPSLTGSVTKDSPSSSTVTTISNSTITTNPILLSTTSLTIKDSTFDDDKVEVDGNISSTIKKQHSADDVVMPDKLKPESLLSCQQPTNSNLKIPIDMPKLTSKPPQGPAPLSPRLLAKNAANKIANNQQHSQSYFPSSNMAANVTNNSKSNSSIINAGNGDNNNDLPRGRSKTISVVREHYRDIKYNQRANQNNARREQQPPTSSRSGISPSFVFLQLYHTGQLNINDRPLPVDQSNSKAIQLLDLIPPFETHKIGVLYVGPGQCNNESEILKNRYGSLRYAEFLRNLGTLVAIKDAKEHNLFINMESGADGNFTYIWQDDIVQVTFHVATLMPNKEQDPNCNEKKKYIGNDFVTIVYNESGEDYNLNTIKGQFNYASVIVQPLELNTNRVFVRAKDEIAEYVCHSDPKIVSDNSAPLLARQLALHANLASRVSVSLNSKNHSPYASNWLERLRKIKHIRSKLLEESKSTGSAGNTAGAAGNTGTGNPGSGGSAQDISSSRRSHVHDFTLYTQ